MKRRDFIQQTGFLTTGIALLNGLPTYAQKVLHSPHKATLDLYQIFKDPETHYRPFVRWWWNGDKVDKDELSRELRLLKDAGIGGVEINPIQFPARTDDMGKPSLQWLGNQWIDDLQHTFTEAKSLGLTCDLIVGSGWPFGAEYLRGEERAQIVSIATKKLEGAVDFEASIFDLLKEADPAVSSPYAHRTMDILSVQLVPDPFTNMSEVKDYTNQLKSGYINISIPRGKFVLYTLVKITGFLEVINGAPGANGPVLNHYNQAAVSKYLHHMSDTIQQKIGPLSKDIRAFFTDSMELEGANWTADMPQEFKKRRGYDLMPYLAFIEFKTGAMGNVYDYNYGAELGAEMLNIVQRVRYDFDLTKTELLQERFIKTFTDWCKENKVKSRAQAYGRGYYPLDGSFDIDIPECETWIKYGIGKEMGETDNRVGRAYTMVNKFVSSAAHLKGRKQISCEELTNTDMVFNATLEILKIAGDQSAISGVTHPVFHGFNYSPLSAPFPGWIRYGTFINERNNWWPYFKRFTDYKARLSALLQQADMFADIALLPPTADMWTLYGAQNEPFPSFYYPDYLSLVWEAIHQNGSGCDYVSEEVIQNANMHDGNLNYGSRKYHTLFLVAVERLNPATASKLLEFVKNGGRIFCIERAPDKSLGLLNYQQKDQQVQTAVNAMQQYNDRFFVLDKPATNFLLWYKELQTKYALPPYVKIDKPENFVMQLRYQTADADVVFFSNSNMEEAYTIDLAFSTDLSKGRQAWIWDADNGERYKVESNDKLSLYLGPAESTLIVFDHSKKGKTYQPKPLTSNDLIASPNNWNITLKHINGNVINGEMNGLKDLKDVAEYASFSGSVTYQASLNIDNASANVFINLGKVVGISELIINGKTAGVQWYGNRIYNISNFIKTGTNSIEVKVITTMGNYMKTLKDNAVAQYWTNEKRKDQPLQSMGLIGPVTVYRS